MRGRSKTNPGLALLLGLALLGGSLAAAGPAWALRGPELVEQGRELYQEARFPEAQEALRQALGRSDLSPYQRAQAQFSLGLVYLAQGYETYAVEAFATARTFDPSFTPEPGELSPSAREVWELSAPAGQRRSAPPEETAPAAPSEPAPPAPDQPAFRETPISEPVPRLYNLQLAYGVRQGRPVGVTSVFAPSTKRIFLWLAMENVPVGARLRAVWTYLGPEQVQIASTEMLVEAPGDWAQFSCQLAPGRPWPAGPYQVEVLLNEVPTSSARFQVP